MWVNRYPLEKNVSAVSYRKGFSAATDFLLLQITELVLIAVEANEVRVGRVTLFQNH